MKSTRRGFFAYAAALFAGGATVALAKPDGDGITQDADMEYVKKQWMRQHEELLRNEFKASGYNWTRINKT